MNDKSNKRANVRILFKSGASLDVTCKEMKCGFDEHGKLTGIQISEINEGYAPIYLDTESVAAVAQKFDKISEGE